jgi:hypothetical protein
MLASIAIFHIVIWSTALTHAAIVFNGFANALPGIGGSFVRADWSSDFGPDYFAVPSGTSNYGGTTTPTTWADRSFHSGESITLHVRRGIGDTGYTEGTGVISLGASGEVSPSIVHRYRIDNILFIPVSGIGISNTGVLQGTFAFSGVSPTSPLHWSATWEVNVVNSGTTGHLETSAISIWQNGAPLLRIQAGPLPSTQVISGSASGSTESSQIVLYADSDIGGGGMLGESRVSLDLQITFSDQPFVVPGDFNLDGTVNAADYVVWRKNDGTQQGYDTWRANFGRTAALGAASGLSNDGTAAASTKSSIGVPEPAAVLISLIAAIGLVTISGRSLKRAVRIAA